MSQIMDKVVQILKEANSQQLHADEEIRAWQSERNKYSKDFHNEHLLGLEQKRNKIALDATREIENTLSEYRIPSDTIALDAVDPAMIALFNSVIPLNAEDLTEQFKRAAEKGDRASMILIERYAKEKDMRRFTMHVYTAKEHAEALDTLRRFARSVLSRPNYADAWFDAEYLAKATPDPLVRSFKGATEAFSK